VNNKSEDLGFRKNSPNKLAFFGALYSNKWVPAETPQTPVPQTPVFGDGKNRGTINAGEAVRFRVVMPGGDGPFPMFEIHGHSWLQEPYIENSRVLGNNVKSQALGAQILGPHDAINILIQSAGGENGIGGDYLYGNNLSNGGAWGILRVTPKKVK
jgi:hypothetical protein